MRMRGFALAAASAGALMLAACSPQQKEADKLGFASVDEMHDIQTQGWHTKAQYLIDQNSAARKLGFADFDEMQSAKKAGYADKASWDKHLAQQAAPVKPAVGSGTEAANLPISRDDSVRALISAIEARDQETKNDSIKDGSEGVTWFHEYKAVVNSGCQIQYDSTISQRDGETHEWSSTIFVRITINLNMMDSATTYKIEDYDFGPNGQTAKAADIASGDKFVVATGGKPGRVMMTSSVKTKFDPLGKPEQTMDFSVWYFDTKTQSEAERFRSILQSSIDSCRA